MPMMALDGATAATASVNAPARSGVEDGVAVVDRGELHEKMPIHDSIGP
jgi:hypothetical protein